MTNTNAKNDFSYLFYTSASREATYMEKYSFNEYFPSKVNSTQKYIGSGVKFMSSAEEYKQICSVLECNKVSRLLIFQQEKLMHTLISSYYEKPKEIFAKICDLEEFDCQIGKKINVVVTPNCRGWAFGIANFIPKMELVDGKAPEIQIKEYISILKVAYPVEHPANVLGLLNNFDLDKISKTQTPTHNSVALYFTNDGKSEHAARYLSKLSDGEVLNEWTSKWGIEEGIFSHEFDHFLNNDQVYADYITEVYFIPILLDEHAQEL